MPDPQQNPHDALFQHVFSQPEHAAGELRHVLPDVLAQAIDWNTLTVHAAEQVGDDLRSVHADLLCSVVLRGRPAFLYVLVEHKSWADRWTPLQLIVYMGRIWQGWRRQHADAEDLPPIVPVVVHHSGRLESTCCF